MKVDGTKYNSSCLLSEITTSDLWLHAIAAHEEEVSNITIEALKSVDTNLKGPYSYLEIYETYLHILNGEAESAMLKFMKTDPFPLLEVLSQLNLLYNCQLCLSINQHVKYLINQWTDFIINF